MKTKIPLEHWLSFPFKDWKILLIMAKNPFDFTGSLKHWKEVYKFYYEDEPSNDIEEIKTKIHEYYLKAMRG